jgi:hypothetical protein
MPDPKNVKKPTFWSRVLAVLVLAGIIIVCMFILYYCSLIDSGELREDDFFYLFP